MLAIAWAFIRPMLWKLLLIGAVVLTILGVLAKIKNAGRLQERVEAQERTIKIVKRKKELQRETRERLRASGSSANDELMREWSRD